MRIFLCKEKKVLISGQKENFGGCIIISETKSISKFTNTFEKKLINLTKTKYSIATINGTAAIQIAIKAIGIKKNDEILIPNLNYIGSSNATVYCGAIPHFVDIEDQSFGIDVNKLKIVNKSKQM